jgi:uncharacterized membrane protein YecN with MAPEG domain
MNTVSNFKVHLATNTTTLGDEADDEGAVIALEESESDSQSQSTASPNLVVARGSQKRPFAAAFPASSDSELEDLAGALFDERGPQRRVFALHRSSSVRHYDELLHDMRCFGNAREYIPSFQPTVLRSN